MNAASISARNAPERIHYIDIASVSPGHVGEVQEMAFSDAPSRARRIVKHGDIIWSSVRPNLRSFALVLNPVQNLIASTGFAVLSAKGVSYSYLYQIASGDEFTEHLVKRARGSAYPAVNTEDFASYELFVPARAILQQFQNIVDPQLLMTHTLEQKSRLLSKTRDHLLPKLISGQVDVSELDIDVCGEAVI